MKAERVIGIDLGGTNLRISLARADEVGGDPEHTIKFSTNNFDSLESALNEVKAKSAVSISRFVGAIAGPISKDGKSVSLTNLNWSTTTQSIANVFGISEEEVKLINDFAAIGAGINVLRNTDFHHFEWSGKINESNPIESISKWKIIGPGTGLGKGFIILKDEKVFISDSEGGHIRFAPVNKEQENLVHFIKRKTGVNFVSQETVLRGSALKLIYDFVKETYYDSIVEISSITDKFNTEDPSAVITKSALGIYPPSNTCIYAHNLYESIFGSITGDDAMDANGGVILAGGITPKILNRFKSERSPFAAAYFERDLPGFVDVAKNLPVLAVLNDSVGLKGATEVAKPINQGKYVFVSS